MANTLTPPVVVVAPPPQRRNPLPVLALLALNGLAGVAVWQSMERPIDTAPIKGLGVNVPLATPSTSDLVPLPRPRSVAELPETARRPLFSMTRRPWAEKPKARPEDPVVKVTVPPAPPPPVFPASQLQLVGVIQATRNNPARVLIRVAGDSLGTWVQMGESIRGWKLRDVTSDSAILEARGEPVELLLDAAPQVTQQMQQPQPRR
jgi:hypothetical protein